MTQQTEMFIRQVLLGEIPMDPNANGLFTIDQVAVLASKRGCSIHKAGDYGIEIKYPGKLKGQWTHAKIMAHDKGLWHPVNVFRACREAAGQPHYEIDYTKAKIKNPGNLNEVLIASIVGADGVRPYLSRPGQYKIKHVENGDFQWMNPDSGNFLELPKAVTGSWTWPMFCVMTGSAPGYIAGAGKSYDYRRALRALDDAVLLRFFVGPHGDFATATFEWLPLAYLQPIERPAPEEEEMDAADTMALMSPELL
jgi:hypothetical protein